MAAIGLLLIIPACADRHNPESLPGLKGIFTDPGFEVRGETRQDQIWISKTQETGIRVLGWKRPPHRAMLLNRKPVAAAAALPRSTAAPARARMIRPQPAPIVRAPSSHGGIALPSPHPAAPVEVTPAIPEHPVVTLPAKKPSRLQKLRDELDAAKARIRRLEGR